MMSHNNPSMIKVGPPTAFPSPMHKGHNQNRVDQIPKDASELLRQLRNFQETGDVPIQSQRIINRIKKQELSREHLERKIMESEDYTFSEEGRRRMKLIEDRLQMEAEDIISMEIENIDRSRRLNELREKIHREAEERILREKKERDEKKRAAEERRRQVLERMRLKKEQEEKVARDHDELAIRMKEAEERASENEAEDRRRDRSRMAYEDELSRMFEVDWKEEVERVEYRRKQKFSLVEWEAAQRRKDEEDAVIQRSRQQELETKRLRLIELKRAQEATSSPVAAGRGSGGQASDVAAAREQSSKLARQLRIQNKARFVSKVIKNKTEPAAGAPGSTLSLTSEVSVGREGTVLPTVAKEEVKEDLVPVSFGILTAPAEGSTDGVLQEIRALDSEVSVRNFQKSLLEQKRALKLSRRRKTELGWRSAEASVGESEGTPLVLHPRVSLEHLGGEGGAQLSEEAPPSATDGVEDTGTESRLLILQSYEQALDSRLHDLLRKDEHRHLVPEPSATMTIGVPSPMSNLARISSNDTPGKDAPHGRESKRSFASSSLLVSVPVDIGRGSHRREDIFQRAEVLLRRAQDVLGGNEGGGGNRKGASQSESALLEMELAEALKAIPITEDVGGYCDKISVAMQRLSEASKPHPQAQSQSQSTSSAKGIAIAWRASLQGLIAKTESSSKETAIPPSSSQPLVNEQQSDASSTDAGRRSKSISGTATQLPSLIQGSTSSMLHSQSVLKTEHLDGGSLESILTTAADPTRRPSVIRLPPLTITPRATVLQEDSGAINPPQDQVTKHPHRLEPVNAPNNGQTNPSSHRRHSKSKNHKHLEERVSDQPKDNRHDSIDGGLRWSGESAVATEPRRSSTHSMDKSCVYAQTQDVGVRSSEKALLTVSHNTSANDSNNGIAGFETDTETSLSDMTDLTIDIPIMDPSLLDHSELAFSEEALEALDGWDECVHTTMASSVHHAAFYGYDAVLEALSHFFDVFVMDDKGRTPLFFAALRNQLGCVATLVSVDPSWIDVGDYKGDTPLHAAAISDGVEVLEFLLSCECNPNTANFSGFTPAHLAKTKEALVLLHKAGATLYCMDSQGRIPLWIAASEGRTECVKFLCSTTPPEFLLWKDVEGNSSLHAACMNGHHECVDVICNWLTNYEELDVRNNKLYSCAHVSSSVDVLKTLYVNGAELWPVDAKGRHPLFVAAFHGRVDCVGFLLENGGLSNRHLISSADSQGDTALHVACLCGHTQCAILLTYFIRNVPNLQGICPDQLAQRANHLRLSELVRHIDHQRELNLSEEDIFGCSFELLNTIVILYGSRWIKLYDNDTGSLYYFDRARGVSQWDRPDSYDEDPLEEQKADKVRQVLIKFFSVYDTSILPNVDEILMAHKKNYNKLFLELLEKYKSQDFAVYFQLIDS